MIDPRKYFMKNTGYIDNVNKYQEQEMKYIREKFIRDRNKNDTYDEGLYKDIFDMSIKEIYDKLTNILPNLYDDYYKEYLIAVSNYPSVGDKLEENEIMKTSLKNTLMNSRNIMYVGIWIILIAILLFILDI